MKLKSGVTPGNRLKERCDTPARGRVPRTSTQLRRQQRPTSQPDKGKKRQGSTRRSTRTQQDKKEQPKTAKGASTETGARRCVRGEGVQGVLTLFCSGAAQVCHDDRVVELKEQLEVEEEDGDRQEEEEEVESGEGESRRVRHG